VAELQNTTENSDKSDLSIDKNGLLRFKNRIYIPDSTELKLTVLDEVHKKPYSGHPGYQKMITTLRKLFYWPNMKGETTKYLAKCQDCQQVKAEHQHHLGSYTWYQSCSSQSGAKGLPTYLESTQK
jgi:hypothetical protein